MLVATVVDHCTLIKHRENLICTVVFPDISDDKNTNYIKICELSTASHRVMYMTVRFSYGITGLYCL